VIEIDVPDSVRSLLERLQVRVSNRMADRHLSATEVNAALGTAERRVAATGDAEYAVFRLSDGIAIVALQDRERTHDLWWTPAGAAALTDDGTGPSTAATHLLHCW